MAEKLDKKKLVTLDELTLSNAWEQEALIEVLVAKSIITKREVLDMLAELRRRNPTAAASYSVIAADPNKMDILVKHILELAVYRTEDDQYVVSIQYRTPLGDYRDAQQPYDRAVIVGDTDALAEELARYDPLAYLVHRPHDRHDPNFLKTRYWEQVRTLFRLIQRVQEGERPPLYEPVVIEWGEIDDDVRDAFASAGAEEGISGHE